MKGSYILVIFLKADTSIEIGKLGKILFKKGFYLYVGSAMGSSGSTTLINRVKRHVVPPDGKKIHWHIDYLLGKEGTNVIKIYLVPCVQKLECVIAKELFNISDGIVKNFGSSDCNCESHLLYMRNLGFLNKKRFKKPF